MWLKYIRWLHWSDGTALKKEGTIKKNKDRHHEPRNGGQRRKKQLFEVSAPSPQKSLQVMTVAHRGKHLASTCLAQNTCMSFMFKWVPKPPHLIQVFFYKKWNYSHCFKIQRHNTEESSFLAANVASLLKRWKITVDAVHLSPLSHPISCCFHYKKTKQTHTQDWIQRLSTQTGTKNQQEATGAMTDLLLCFSDCTSLWMTSTHQITFAISLLMTHTGKRYTNPCLPPLYKWDLFDEPFFLCKFSLQCSE